jgi:hypothetical protein
MQLQSLILSLLLVDVALATQLRSYGHHRRPSPRPVCGLVGYDYGHRYISSRQCSLAQCASVCKKTTKCQSYGYNQKKNSCRLYSSPVRRHVSTKRSFGRKFWDRGCPRPVVMTTRRTTTARKTTTRRGITTARRISTTTRRRLTTITSAIRQPTTTARIATTIGQSTSAPRASTTTVRPATATSRAATTTSRAAMPTSTTAARPTTTNRYPVSTLI